MMPFRRTILVAAALWPCVAFAAAPEQDTTNGVAPTKPGTEAPAAEAAPAEAAHAAAPAEPLHSAAKAAAPAETPKGSDVQRFCQNITAAAADARNAWQTKKLNDLQQQVAKSIADLESRQAELKEIIAKREDALKRADDTLVAIFAKMTPDAAAGAIAALDDDMAAALLQKLSPRAASAILNEVAPDRAVRLVNTIAGAPPPADGKKS